MADVDDSSLPQHNDSDPMHSTAEVIEAARRPLLVARHKVVVGAALEQIGDPLLDEMDPDQQEAADLVSVIAEDDNLHSASLAEGMLERACMARENGEIADHDLLTTLAGAYARIRQLLANQQGRQIPFGDLQTLSCGKLHRLLNPLEVLFASASLKDRLVFTQSQSDRCRQSLRLIIKASGADECWRDAAGDPMLPRELEEPIESLPEEQRRRARLHLVRDRIRHRFFKKVFLVYFDRDTLDPEEVAAHPAIVDWLEAIADTPHLFPFMQGQTQEQKIYRLRQLWRKILQLNELYQRVEQASSHPTYRERFADLGTRERLSILAADRYPALKVDNDFSVYTALCPFRSFASWIQDKVTSKDFVLPPEADRPQHRSV
ncbi:MAG: hypothetical protein EA402_12655 [Planctomycetota bacterium]|nr:MAG: hypothetical protein EA402_12655 [Planctomycetota bacterium]